MVVSASGGAHCCGGTFAVLNHWLEVLQALDFSGWNLCVGLGVMRLRIEYQGLVDLISDQTSRPGPCCVLMPNATDPDAAWIPEALRFSTPHFARLVISENCGRLLEVPSDVPRTSYPADGGRPAFSLDGYQIRVLGSPTPLTADRESAPDCADLGNCGSPPNSQTSVFLLALLDDLARRMRRDCHAPYLGSVDLSLTQGNVSSPARITSRMMIDCGHLCTAKLWGDCDQPPRPYIFQVNPSPRRMIPIYRAFLGESLFLKTQVIDVVKIEFTRLATMESAGTLVIEPNDPTEPVRLIVKNLDEREYDDGLHFLAHYLILKGWESIRHARFPDTRNWIDPTGLDPICSPGDAKAGS